MRSTLTHDEHKGEHPSVEQVIEGVLQVLHKGDDASRLDASRALFYLFKEYRDELMDPLSILIVPQLSALKDKDWRLRAQTIVHLQSHGIWNDEIVEAVVLCLMDSNVTIRRLAVMALQRFGILSTSQIARYYASDTDAGVREALTPLQYETFLKERYRRHLEEAIAAEVALRPTSATLRVLREELEKLDLPQQPADLPVHVQPETASFTLPPSPDKKATKAPAVSVKERLAHPRLYITDQDWRPIGYKRTALAGLSLYQDQLAKEKEPKSKHVAPKSTKAST